MKLMNDFWMSEDTINDYDGLKKELLLTFAPTTSIEWDLA